MANNQKGISYFGLALSRCYTAGPRTRVTLVAADDVVKALKPQLVQLRCVAALRLLQAQISDTEWWIDGNLSTDVAGNLYATWDTQSPSGDSDIGWLSYSTDGGRTWSAPTRVTPDQGNAVHILASAGAGPGVTDVAWLADNSPQGYALYFRPFSIKDGWLAPITQVSSQFGDPTIWPGDTFGISVPPEGVGPGAPQQVDLSWGSAVGGSQDSEIYATVMGR